MSERKEVRLTSEGGPLARLWIDGKDVSSAVNKVIVSASAEGGTTVMIHLPQPPISVDLAETPVRIPIATCDLLVQLGWTPPSEEDES